MEKARTQKKAHLGNHSFLACTLVLNSCCLAVEIEEVMSFHLLGFPLQTQA